MKQLARKHPGLPHAACSGRDGKNIGGAGDGKQHQHIITYSLRMHTSSFVSLFVDRLSPAFTPVPEIFPFGSTQKGHDTRSPKRNYYAGSRTVQRDILGVMDILNQRVKALELVVTGSAWSARKMAIA